MTHDDPSIRILLVEDQERHRQIYAAAIKDNLGASVLFAADGKEALAVMASETPPDLVVLDLEIPRIAGEEVLSRIKADHRLRFTPVIVLTGVTDFATQMRLLEAGADDFIEKGSSPVILIARMRAQIRHKLAVDRLERLALDRDLFAAGVLQDISSIKWTIVSLCRDAKDMIRRDPVQHKAEALQTLAKLSAHGTRLGDYASDVIQSVRETHRAPRIEAQDIGKLCAWALEVSEAPQDGASEGGVQAPRPTLQADAGLKPVLADKSFLRLAVLNIVQNAVKFARPDQALVLSISQTEHDRADDPMGRRFVTTRLRDNGRGMTDRQLARAFQPRARIDDGDETQGPGSDRAGHGGFSIGLSLVAKVMTKMGGRAWAERAPDGGTVMCLDLPVA